MKTGGFVDLLGTPPDAHEITERAASRRGGSEAHVELAFLPGSPKCIALDGRRPFSRQGVDGILLGGGMSTLTSWSSPVKGGCGWIALRRRPYPRRKPELEAMVRCHARVVRRGGITTGVPVFQGFHCLE